MPFNNRLENLIKLNLSHNQLTSLPVYFFDLRNLRSLNLCHNRLEALDEDLGRLNMLEAGFIFGHLVRDPHLSTMSRDVADIHGDRADFASGQEVQRNIFYRFCF